MYILLSCEESLVIKVGVMREQCDPCGLLGYRISTFSYNKNSCENGILIRVEGNLGKYLKKKNHMFKIFYPQAVVLRVPNL